MTHRESRYTLGDALHPPSMSHHAPTFFAIALLCGLAATPASALAPPARPNVLLVVADDQGYGDLSIHGNPHLRTQRHRLVREIKGAAGGSKARANDDSAGAWQLYDMEADPGETTDLAAREPDTVARLAALYDAWFADVSRERLERLPLPVGHAEQNPVELHAPQAYFEAPLHFASGPGFANDWLTGWNDPQARVWFEIDAARAGDYAIEIACSCPPEDAGSRLRITAGDAVVEVAVPAATPVDLPLPHRDPAGHARYRSRVWATLDAGTLPLSAGRTRLMLEAVAMPGGQVLDPKHVVLRGPAGE